MSSLGGGRYKILRELGRGSCGVVYVAFDQTRGAAVALKTLLRLDRTTLASFKKEFRSLRDVTHTNVVELYDLALDDGQWFFTMELVDGEDWLAHVARTDRAGLYDALLQLLRGLEGLHARGVVHRDVKPSNVLVAGDGRVVIVDLGLARDLGVAAGVVTDSLPVGTPSYVAPELVASAPTSPAADMYAVGVMLFEALTGGRPFAGTSLDVIMAKTAQDAPRARSLAPNVPRELDALCAALLARDPAARPSASDVLARLATEAGAGASVPPRSLSNRATDQPLVGREGVLDQLLRAFERVASGDARLLLVRGRSGIGKSALVRAFTERVAGAARVFSGRCFEREEVPYKAFEGVLAELSRLDLAAPRDVAALLRVFPALDAIPAIARAEREPLKALDPEEIRRRAFDAFAELLGELGRKSPLVLALDDFQWADPESALLLSHLTRPGPRRPPMLAVVAYRAEDVVESHVLGGLEGEPGAALLDLAPLARSDAEGLARRLLGRAASAEAVRVVAAESGGSPFFLGELARFAGTAGPGALSLADVLARHIAALPPDARALLEAIALAGRPIAAHPACEAAGLAHAAGERAAKVLRVEHLLRTAAGPQGELLECFHDRVRETVASTIAEPRQRELHLALAHALERAPDPDAETLYGHYLAARVRDRAAELAELLATRAEAALAFGQAARLYRSTLDNLPADDPRRRGLVRRLAEALRRAGRAIEAADAFQAAIEGADPREQLVLRHRAAEQLLYAGRLVPGMAALRSILEILGVPPPRTRLRAIVTLLVTRLWLSVRGLRIPGNAAEADATALLRIDAMWSVASGLSLVDAVLARALAAKALAAALWVGEPARVARHLLLHAGFEGAEGVPAKRKVEAFLGAFRAVAPRVASPELEALHLGCLGWVRFFQGDFPSAKTALDAAVDSYWSYGFGTQWERDSFQQYALLVRFHLGQIAELVARYDATLADARARGDRYAETMLVTSRANCRWLRDGDYARKRREVDEALGRWGRGERFQVQDWYALQSHWQIDMTEGRPRDALARARAVVPGLRESLLFRIQFTRGDARYMQAASAVLSALAASGDERAALLVESKKAARALAREGVPYCVAMAAAIEPALACADGASDATVDECLDRAASAFTASHMPMHAASASYHRGGAARDGALVWMREQGIADPSAIARLFVPLP